MSATPAQIHAVAWAEGLRLGALLATPRRDVLARAKALGLLDYDIVHMVDRSITTTGWRPYIERVRIRPTERGLALLAA